MLILLSVLAGAAVILDDPARWSSGYGPLRHAGWDGALVADFVTPLLLFFLGAALTMRRRAPPLHVVLGASAALIACGLAVNGFVRPDLETWRVTGVPQRAGVTLALAGVCNALAAGDHRRRISLLTSIAALITLTHWLVMAHVPGPLGVTGDLSPGDNIAAVVDRALLGRHAWSAEWDPDGILSTLASMSTVLAGMVSAIALTSNVHGRRNALQLAGGGAGAIVGGLLWTVMVPINRSLWSASFVVVTAGAGAILLTAFAGRQRR